MMTVEQREEEIFMRATQFRLTQWIGNTTASVSSFTDDYAAALRTAWPIWKKGGRLVIHAMTDAGDVTLLPKARTEVFAKLWLARKKVET